MTSDLISQAFDPGEAAIAGMAIGSSAKRSDKNSVSVLADKQEASREAWV